MAEPRPTDERLVQRLLDGAAAAAAARRSARAATDDAYDEWRSAIRSALEAGVPAAEVAAAAGTTVARVRQVAGLRPPLQVTSRSPGHGAPPEAGALQEHGPHAGRSWSAETQATTSTGSSPSTT